MDFRNMHTIHNANVSRFDEAQRFNLRARRRGSPLSGGSSGHAKSTPQAPSQNAIATPQSVAELSKEEIRLAKMWHKEDGMDPSEIGDVLRRDKSTMTRLLVKRTERKTDGRPQLLDDDAIDALVAHLDHMIVTADGKYEDTADKLRQHARVGFTMR
jgi:hypothetical protein